MLSISQIKHRHSLFPAWLGIMAILMLFIAPVVSKSLVAEGMSHSMMPGMSMSGMDMSSMDMSHGEMLSGSAHHHVMPDHDIGLGMLPGDMSDSACGYCVLLVHLPLLHLLALPMLWVSHVSSRAPPHVVAVHLVPATFYSDAQPRAPPEFR